MKNSTLTTKDIKALETKIQEVTGLENVEIVIPVSMQELPPLDFRLLEMENKLNLAKHRKTPRMARNEARIAARNSMMDKAMNVFDSVLDVIEEPKKLLNIKPVGAVANYFFMLDDEEEDTDTHAPMQDAAPAPIKEGKVIHHNFRK